MISNHPENQKDETSLFLEDQNFRDEIRAHIGTRRHKSNAEIKASFNMLITQYRQLLLYIMAPEEDRGIPLDINLVAKLQTAVDEKILLATSSMSSFLDIIDSAKDWENTDYFCDVKEKNNQIMKKENNAFLKKLRQYLNHYGLIPWRFDWGTNKSFTFRIDADEMLKFNGWNRSDKKIIRELVLREISLSSIIDAYMVEMALLWYPAIEALYYINNDALEETNLMKSKAFSVLTDGNFSSAEEFYRTVEDNIRASRKNE